MTITAILFLLMGLANFSISIYYIVKLKRTQDDGRGYEAWIVAWLIFGFVFLSFFIAAIDNSISVQAKLFQRSIEVAINLKLIHIGLINRLAKGYYERNKFNLVAYKFIHPFIETLTYVLLCVPFLFISSGVSIDPPRSEVQAFIHSGYYSLNVWFQYVMFFTALVLGLIFPSYYPHSIFKTGAFLWAGGPLMAIIADNIPGNPNWLYIANWFFVAAAIFCVVFGIIMSRRKFKKDNVQI